jgi:tRNA(Ile)-lysidine synthase
MVIETLRQQLASCTSIPRPRYLLAVSTGVDSMVLLTAMEKLFADQKDKPFAVAHVNHQLRTASKEEAAFLSAYCATRDIVYFERTWEKRPAVGVEAAARAFRYDFFKEIMAHDHYPILLTAHHGDDQAETMVMKMVRDGSLHNAFGMRQTQHFGQGLLLRPLLKLSKDDIHAFAAANQVPHFEDETNQQDLYLRNRIRHHIIPTLKKENVQAIPHFQQLSEEMIYGQELIADLQKEWLSRYVERRENQQIVWLEQLSDLSTAARYWFFAGLLQQTNSQQGALNHKQLQQVLDALDTPQGQWQIDMGGLWQIRRSYDVVILEQKSVPSETAVSSKQEMRVGIGSSLFLSENEWIGFFRSDHIEIPKKITNWSEFSQDLPLNYSSELILRKRKPGDRIQLQANLRKKISRYFIDGKVPNEQREKSWVVTTPGQEVVALIPYVFSYLSIAAETDKIHYILLYKYQE